MMKNNTIGRKVTLTREYDVNIRQDLYLPKGTEYSLGGNGHVSFKSKSGSWEVVFDSSVEFITIEFVTGRNIEGYVVIGTVDADGKRMYRRFSDGFDNTLLDLIYMLDNEYQKIQFSDVVDEVIDRCC